jgi:predicted signal transduction protein with EAL and GGDEF domain
MPSEPLIDQLPELVLLVKRDGVLLGHVGGRGLAALRLPLDSVGRRVESLWPESVATLIRRLVKRSIAERAPADAEVLHDGAHFQLRVTPQGPDRAICSIRPAVTRAPHDGTARGNAPVSRRLERRSFARHFRDSLAAAALREQPLAVAIVLLDGVTEIGRVIDGRVAEQVVRTAIERLTRGQTAAGTVEPAWYLGRLSDAVVAFVLESADRNAIDECVTRVCRSLRAPVELGDASFHLTPYAGAAILGQDAAEPGMLLDHARAAATEARRSGATDVRFFTDTIELRSLARLDIARELRDAIAERAIRLRYAARHDLATGVRVARVGYLQWLHPLRGEVRPAEFVAVAQATGMALSLSRAALGCLGDDLAAAKGLPDDLLCVSFGPLQHHLLHQDFIADVERFLAETALPAGRLELRISERTFVALDAATPRALARLGLRLVVDEVGRDLVSLDRLARAPLIGLQLDRSWATALRHDAVAQRVCRAGLAVANALGLTPIATGVDDAEQQRALLELGCREGIGDYYADLGDSRDAAAPAAASK